MGLAALLMGLAMLAAPDAMQPVRTALDRGDVETALRQLEQIERERPAEFEWNQLGYLRGVLLLRLGRNQAARNALLPFSEPGAPFAENALLHLMDAADGTPEQATYVDRFLKEYPDHPRSASLSLKRGVEFKKAGRLEEAKRLIDLAWRDGRGSIARRAALEHALLHLEKKETSEAIRDLERILAKDERDDAARDAALWLHEIQPVKSLHEGELRRRVRVFLNNRDGNTARLYLRHAIDHFPSSLAADQYAYLWGRSLVIDGRLEEAQEAYRQAYERFPKTDWGVYCLYQGGNVALRVLDYAQAEAFYRRVVTQHPSSRYAPRAWYNLADTLLWLGRRDDAREALAEALRQSPRREQNQFRYALARLHLMEGRLAEGLQGLEKLDHLSSELLPSGVTREEIYFLKGLALERLQRREAAEEAYRTAASGSRNYFAFTARDRLADPLARSAPESDEPWLRRLIPPRPWRATAPGPESGRIQDLLFLQLYDEAALAIRSAEPAAAGGDRPSQLFNLAYYAARGGLAEESIRAAERLQSVAFRTQEPSSYPPVVQSLLYPRHFADLVERYSRQNRIEPELVLSVIRQESRFQSDAKSVAAARGLMQFMSGTARSLARELDLPPPQESDLYRQELSVRLGAFYLRKLLNQFDGSIEKALAAYNGGAENVTRWASKLDHADGPFFVANIGFRETKLYVLKVMGNYYIYKQLADQANDGSRAAPEVGGVR